MDFLYNSYLLEETIDIHETDKRLLLVKLIFIGLNMLVVLEIWSYFVFGPCYFILTPLKYSFCYPCIYYLLLESNIFKGTNSILNSIIAACIF